MKLIYTSNLAPFPILPPQRFVDEQGHDITEQVTAYDAELFEALAEMHARQALMEHLGPVIEAIRHMMEEGKFHVVRIPVERAEEPEYQFDPAYVPGNATRH